MDPYPFINLIGDVLISFQNLVIAIIGAARNHQHIMAPARQRSRDVVNRKLLGIEELAHDQDFHLPIIIRKIRFHATQCAPKHAILCEPKDFDLSKSLLFVFATR